jgi:phage tail sheath protein FI
MYTCDGKKIKYLKHRRGIDATADLLKDGKVVAVIYDKAVAMVADVTFTFKADRDDFLKAAKLAGFGLPTDDHCISEYARKLLEEAEDAS